MRRRHAGWWLACTFLLLPLLSMNLSMTTSEKARDILINRLWLDRPQSEYNPFRMYVLHRMDAQGDHTFCESSYRSHLEVFFYRASDNRINFHFKHDNRRASTSYSIKRASSSRWYWQLDLAQDPMLNGRPGTYYGGQGELPEPAGASDPTHALEIESWLHQN